MLATASQSAFVHLVSVLLGLLPVPTGAAGLLGLATVAVAGVLLVLLVVQARGDLADLAGSVIRGRATALRERSRHSAHLRLRDPDDAGRPRPRAPGFASSAV
jgi:hypothetical protein